MKRLLFTTFAGAILTAGFLACGSSTPDEQTMQPTQAELDAIDAAAEAAAEKITPETADAEFERLKAEMGEK